MRVTALVVAYHADKWLPACLDSLVSASKETIHLLLVDNSGNSGFDTLGLDRFDTEIIKTPAPLGFAEANNFALAHAARLENAILFLNQDTISYPGWIDHCLACLSREAGLGAVSPLIRTYDGSGWDPSFLACFGPDADVAGACSERSWIPSNVAPAPALIVRKDVLRLTGPFDPVFGSYYEDYDLCLRIREAGYMLGFSCNAEIAHFSGSTTDTRERELRRMRQIIRNRLLYDAREAKGSRWRVLLRHFGINLPRNLARGLMQTSSSQPPAITLQAHWDLLKIAGRVASIRRDRQAWQAYLNATGWPSRIPGLNPSEIVPQPEAR